MICSLSDRQQGVKLASQQQYGSLQKCAPRLGRAHGIRPRFGARTKAVAERLDGSSGNAARGVFCELFLHVDGSATAVVRALMWTRYVSESIRIYR